MIRANNLNLINGLLLFTVVSPETQQSETGSKFGA